MRFKSVSGYFLRIFPLGIIGLVAANLCTLVLKIIHEVRKILEALFSTVLPQLANYMAKARQANPAAIIRLKGPTVV